MHRAEAVLVGLAPGLVSVAWLPVRNHLPNTDVALVLVVAVAGVGFVAGRLGTVVGASSAGLSFDLLHTRPYGHLAISHDKDALTTAFLVVAGVAMGELASRLASSRRRAASEADAFALVSDAAGLVATGSDAALVVEALTEELARGLQLRECRYEPGSPAGDAPIIARDGMLVDMGNASTDSSAVDLPIWASGTIVAHFRLMLGAEGLPTLAQRRLAVSVSDQAGAALVADGHSPPSVPRGSKRLRLVRD